MADYLYYYSKFTNFLFPILLLDATSTMGSILRHSSGLTFESRTSSSKFINLGAGMVFLVDLGYYVEYSRRSLN